MLFALYGDNTNGKFECIFTAYLQMGVYTGFTLASKDTIALCSLSQGLCTQNIFSHFNIYVMGEYAHFKQYCYI